MERIKGKTGLQAKKPVQNLKKAGPKKNIPMGQATFGTIEGFSASSKPDVKVGLKGQVFPDRKQSGTMSYNALLYEPEGFAGLKPPGKKGSPEKGMTGKRLQQSARKLDPILTVSDNQTGWVMSGGSSGGDRLSGKRSIPPNRDVAASPGHLMKQRVSPSRSLLSPTKSVSPDRLAPTLTLESLSGAADANKTVHFPSSKSVLPDISQPQTTSREEAGEEGDTLSDTLRTHSTSPQHRGRRGSTKPEDNLDSGQDPILTNTAMSPQRRQSVRPGDTDGLDDLTSTIGSQRRGSIKPGNGTNGGGDDLNSTVGSVGSRRRSSIRPAAAEKAEKAEKAARGLALLDAVISGDIQQVLPPQGSTTIRIFLSSTFSDFKMERNVLARRVYPELEEYCRELGLKFEVVDLRWGITDEVVNEHLVEKLCLLEVKNCKQISPNLNFVAMLGQRYGYRALPPEIESIEFETLKDISEKENIGGRHLMDVWYKLDTNSIPPVYVLQPIKAMIPEYAEAEAETRRTGRRLWDEQRCELQTCLRGAAAGSSLEEIRRDKYFISVTEQEVITGILLNKGVKSDAFCFTRDMTNIEQDLDSCKTRRFMDAVPVDGRYVPCSDSADHQTSLKKKIQSVLPKDHVMEFTVQWSTDGMTENDPNHVEYLHKFCENMKDKTKLVVNRQSEEMKQRDEDMMSNIRNFLSMKNQVKPNAKNATKSSKSQGQAMGLTEADFMVELRNVKQLQLELQRAEDDQVEQQFVAKALETYKDILHHLHFGQNKLSNFTGREKECSLIQAYLKQVGKTQSPYLVHGAPGHGKTAFMASIAEKARESLKNCVVVVRFLGTSSSSSSVGPILKSMCVHICLAYGIEVDLTSLATVRKTKIYFRDLLTIVSHQYGSARPLVIILEAVDILHTEGSPSNLSWIPSELPPNICMFVSVKSDTASHKLMSNKVKAPNELQLGSFKVEDVKQLVNGYYQNNNRTVTDKQKQVIFDLLAKSPVPLYCNLVLDASLSWKSYTDIGKQVLPETVAIAVKNMFINLESKYGPEFIKASLGYLSICNDGISEKELDDALSMNNTVLDEAYKYHSPPAEGVIRMPPLMWARLKHDLKQYLGRKLVFGLTTVCWYYQEFMEMALDIYVVNTVRKQLHMDLVQLFSVEGPYLKSITLSQRNLTIENANRLVSVQPMTGKNPRKLRSLLFHYRRSGDIEGMKRNLFLNCMYLRCYIEAFGMDDFLQTVASVQAHLKDDDIAEVLRAVRFSHRQIANNPQILTSQLLCYLSEIRAEKTENDRMCKDIEQDMQLPALVPHIKCPGSSNESFMLAIENVSSLYPTMGVGFSAAMVKKGDVQVISHDVNAMKKIKLEKSSDTPTAMQISKDGKVLIVLFKDAVHLYGPHLLKKFSNRANSAENLGLCLCASTDFSTIFLASKGRLGSFENTGKNEFDYKPKAAMNLSGSTATLDLVILNDTTTLSTHTVQGQKGSLMGAIICWSHQEQKITTKMGLPSLPVKSFLFVTRQSQFVISGCDNGQIFLIDITEGKIVHDFQLRPVKTKLESFLCDFDKGEDLLVAAFPDKVTRLWKIQGGISSVLKTLKLAEVATSISLNSELGFIFTGMKGGSIVSCDFNTDKQFAWEASESSEISNIQSTRQSTLFSLSGRGELKVWDTDIMQTMMIDERKDKSCQKEGGLSDVKDTLCFAFTPDSKHLITGSATASNSWNVDNGHHIKKLDNIDSGTKMGGIIVSDIPRLVVLQQGNLKVMNIETTQVIDNLDKVSDFKAYSDYLIAIGMTLDNKPELLLYDWDQHYLADSVTLLPSDISFQGPIKSKLFEDLDGLILVRLSSQDSDNGQCHITAVQQEGTVRLQQSIAVKSFKEQKFAVNLGKKTALLLDRTSADVWKPFESNSPLIKASAVQQFLKSNKLSYTGVLSKNQNILALGSGSGRILVCGNPAHDNTTVKPQTLKGHKSKVTCLRFLEDNRHLLSGSTDRRLIVWDVETASIVQQIYTHTTPLHIQLSPDHSQLAILAKAHHGNSTFMFQVKRQE